MALIFLFLLFLPKSLIVPNMLWFKLGLFLGAIVSLIIMGIIFFTVTPTGLIMRFWKDILIKRLIKQLLAID